MMYVMRTPWKKWFAWHPVTINGKLTWLKTVYRRGSGIFWRHHTWEYGTIFDILQSEVRTGQRPPPPPPARPSSRGVI